MDKDDNDRGRYTLHNEAFEHGAWKDIWLTIPSHRQSPGIGGVKGLLAKYLSRRHARRPRCAVYSARGRCRLYPFRYQYRVANCYGLTRFDDHSLSCCILFLKALSASGGWSWYSTGRFRGGARPKAG